MREIKFRGRTRNGVWIYGALMDDSHIYNPSNYTTYSVDKETVGQFTGIKDKYAKDLYCGDIVEFQNDVNYQTGGKMVLPKGCYVVNNGAFTIYFPEFKSLKFLGVYLRSTTLEEDTVHPMSKWLCKIGSYKLTGNLWDNKDMLDFCKRELL